MKYKGSGKVQWQMGCWARCRSEVKGERGKLRPAKEGGSNPGTEEKSSEVHKWQSRVSVEISVLVQARFSVPPPSPDTPRVKRFHWWQQSG